MIPLGHRAVTLYRRERARDEAGRTSETWRRAALTGCSWHVRLEEPQGEHQRLPLATVVCRIPAGQEQPCTGDVLAAGLRTEETPEGLEGAFRVTQVRLNALPGTLLGHWRAEGLCPASAAAINDRHRARGDESNPKGPAPFL